jgi:hypothetical protein
MLSEFTICFFERGALMKLANVLLKAHALISAVIVITGNRDNLTATRHQNRYFL